MTHQQTQTALAMIRCGRSFEEAAQASGISVEDIAAMWSGSKDNDMTNPTTGIDLDGLESTARAAAPGEYQISPLTPSRVYTERGSISLSSFTNNRSNPHEFAETQAAFIAAFNPATALSLISALRASQAETKAALKECGDWAAQAGLAKGKLEASELAGVVEGWQARATTAEALVDRLRQEAEIHAQEARTHKSSLREAYQAIAGAKGEPGSWNGAKPIRAYVAKTEALAKERGEALEDFADFADLLDEETSGFTDSDPVALVIVPDAESPVEMTRVPISAFRRARSALSRTRPSGGEGQ